MLMVAVGYRALNAVVPDAGTSFTWTVKAFGPYAGWMCGWGLIIATVIVLSNTAGVAATFFYLFLGQLLGRPEIVAFGATTAVNVATTTLFVAVATWVAWRGMTTATRVTYVLVGFQLAVLLVFCGLALAKAAQGGIPTAIAFEWAWLNPFAVPSCGGARRRPVAVDLHLLGLGREPLGQRGDDRQRPHAGAGGAAVAGDARRHLRAGRHRHPALRRRRRRRPRPAQ